MGKCFYVYSFSNGDEVGLCFVSINVITVASELELKFTETIIS